jgi:hypothetical protein
MEGSSHSDKRTQTSVKKFLYLSIEMKFHRNHLFFFKKNTHSLEALETFIQAQRALLARQKSDIERLRQLRIDIVQKPSQVLSNLSNEVCCSPFFNRHFDLFLSL